MRTSVYIHYFATGEGLVTQYVGRRREIIFSLDKGRSLIEPCLVSMYGDTWEINGLSR